MDRIVCKNCGAESYHDSGKTGLVCMTCYERLQDELIETKFALDVERNDNDRLRAALNKRKLKGAQT